MTNIPNFVLKLTETNCHSDATVGVNRMYFWNDKIYGLMFKQFFKLIDVQYVIFVVFFLFYRKLCVSLHSSFMPTKAGQMQPKMVSVNALNRTHYREMYIASAV
jgi:hypothetical protein